MRMNTDFLDKCIKTLEQSYLFLKKSKENSIEYEIYRNSIVKSFEMTIEQSGKLLKKKLSPFFSSKKELDRLVWKDLYRYAVKHSLLESEEAERWFKYRDNRNDTAHNYGEEFANKTLALINSFIHDACRLKEMLSNNQNSDGA